MGETFERRGKAPPRRRVGERYTRQEHSQCRGQEVGARPSRLKINETVRRHSGT